MAEKVIQCVLIHTQTLPEDFFNACLIFAAGDHFCVAQDTMWGCGVSLQWTSEIAEKEIWLLKESEYLR